MSTARTILRTSTGARRQIHELLEALFTAELLSPSAHLFLVSPWIRDLELIDNRSGRFSGLDPTWSRRNLRLGEILRVLIERGAHVTLATRPLDENRVFVDRLRRGLPTSARERLTVELRKHLHAKGLVGDDYAVKGSMNFTHNGLENLEELVTFERGPRQVAELRTQFLSEYGGADR